MIAKATPFNLGDEKAIEKLIWDENLHLNHVILPPRDGLPIHDTNSNVYLILIRGNMSLRLAEGEAKKYQRGQILQIPNQTQMELTNQDEDVLEFFIVKAPAPK